jgi:hypothetical protein
MVPPPAPIVKTERHVIMETLHREWQDQYKDITTAKISLEEKSKGIRIRSRLVKLHGEWLQFINEKEDIGILPQQYVKLLTKM